MRAILLELSDGTFNAAMAEVAPRACELGDVLVDVQYSSINYKDALALTNAGPVVRTWPMIPGIDGAGIVLESRHPDFAPGDSILVNGWGLGEVQWGCLAERATLRGDWLLKLPEGLSARTAMIFGTAGYTSMLCTMAIEESGLVPGDGEVLVTGATGGVGSLAVLLLSRLGYRVVASTGRTSEAGYLEELGAATVIDRAELARPGKPLLKERWAAAVDVAGGVTLANVCASTRYGGIVAACGLAESINLPASVAPFILRGVTLRGIDSVMAPMAKRRRAWSRLADVGPEGLDLIGREIAFDRTIDEARELLAGRVRGRVAVRIDNRQAGSA